MKHFDYCIGNPPYMEKAPGTSTSDIPVYHSFMDAAYTIADKVELITPGRFLFNAGATPSAWNQKMLTDTHFKVLRYENDAKAYFPSIELPGGIAISYHSRNELYNPVGLFSQFSVLKKMAERIKEKSSSFLPEIMFSQNKFNLDNIYMDYPSLKKEIGNDGKDKRFRQIAMERFPQLFTQNSDGVKMRTLGLINKERTYRYIDLKYVEENDHIKQYKVFVPFSNGASGTLGNEPARIISKPVIGYPNDGITQTFIGVGGYDTLSEAEALLKYIKSKFCRALLGLLKVTQGNKSETWAYVPNQDYGYNSDIDWSKSIHEIDLQLYKKYDLSPEEIEFIETHVKEMS
ncbi:MAG: Eco57I restriction-modification methylase domain-containing protein [Lachnospiraceae bacterium]|nr:Eco57I restriction-modification methylase domain-containing protein [Lachnospiraceae bacterium]